jgi:hypothetical protein
MAYNDAFVAATQCAQLESIKKDAIWDGAASEQLVYICYRNWVKSQKIFTLPHDVMEKYP